MHSDNTSHRSVSPSTNSMLSYVPMQWLITKRALVTILSTAIVLRLAWAVLQARRGYTHAAGEAYNVALAASNGRGIADAYYVGQGATAHVTPFSPAIAGAVYRVLGNSSVAAEATLTVWAVGLVIAAYLLWYISFAYLDVTYPVRVSGLVVLAVAPMYITLETVDFRVWDGALVSLTSAGLFTLLLRADRLGSAKTSERCSIAALLAFLLFLNPNLGIAAGLATCVLMLRRYNARQAASLVFTTGVILLAIVSPWALRNELAFDAFVPLRSNAGLELAIANYQGAASNKDPAIMYKERLASIHPYTSPHAALTMKRAGGEVRYSSSLGHEASAWVASHPREFVEIYGAHLSQFFFPRQWQFALFGGGATQSLIRTYLSALLSIGAFISLFASYRRRDILWLYPALFFLLPAIIYGVFQPVPRYTYLLYGLSAMMAADGYYRAIVFAQGLRMGRTQAKAG